MNYSEHFTPRDLRERRRALLVKSLDPIARVPQRASRAAAGYDLYALDLVGLPGTEDPPAVIRTGVSVALPDGYFGLIRPKPSMVMGRGLIILCDIIEPDYRGQIVVPACSRFGFRLIHEGEAFAQMIVIPCTQSGVREVHVLPKHGSR